MGPIGCNTVETGLVPLNAIAPEAELDPLTGAVTCNYKTDGETLLSPRVDVQSFQGLTLRVRARNTLTEQENTLDRNNPGSLRRVPNSLNPLRFDFVWECESGGFTNQTALIVPAFAFDRPFCLDNRDDTTGDFVGFDVVSASGPAIDPDAEGLIEFRPITYQLVKGIESSFIMASQAENCCNASANGCAQPDRGIGDCSGLEANFNALTPGRFSLDNPQDLQRWRAFAPHYNTGPINFLTPSYVMRMRGRFEAVSSTGDLVTSTSFQQDMGFCGGCIDLATNLTASCLVLGY
jgi:hypothetical protein